MKGIFLLLTISVLLSCHTAKKEPSETTDKTKTISDDSKIISAPIVKKYFYNKKGEKTDIQEYYIQQSVQDYFIKFCESNVSIQEIDQALEKIDSPIKTLTLEVILLDGEWDSCDGDPVQSRVGKYMIVHKIIN